MKLCDLETSKALQEFGYDGECHRWYSHDGKLKSTNLVDDDIPAPRLDDAAYWLRERKGLYIFINYLQYNGRYTPHIQIMTCDNGHNMHYLPQCDDYDTALKRAVKKAIKIIKEQEL